MIEDRARETLIQMQKAAVDAVSFVDGFANTDFLKDKRTQQAVIMSLVIIGEAATKIMDRHAEIVVTHSNIEWRSMRGMRNRIAHGYFDINLDVVWDTVQTALPALKSQLDALPPT